MNITQEQETHCEFTILALIDKWQSIGNVSAYQIASENNIDMTTWWQTFNDYQAVKRVRHDNI